MTLTFGQNDRILVLSPHLDDAILSVGGIISSSTDAGATVTVLTPFTADAGRQSQKSEIVTAMHQIWGLGDQPFAARRNEDIAAIDIVGGEHVHGGLFDCIYRTTEEGAICYPTSLSVFSAPSPKDQVWVPLKELIAAYIKKVKPDVVLCPLGIGQHVDHVITSKAFRQIAYGEGFEVYLYEDIPYATGKFPPGRPDSVEAALARTEWDISHSERVEINFDRKIQAIECYASQLADIFPDEVSPADVLREYMATLGEGRAYERVWKIGR